MNRQSSTWKSPVPSGIGHGARIFRPDRGITCVADFIVERACIGSGVRVYRWPCGTVAVVRCGGPEDELLEAVSPGRLWGTYVKGSQIEHVKADLRITAEAA